MSRAIEYTLQPLQKTNVFHSQVTINMLIRATINEPMSPAAWILSTNEEPNPIRKTDKSSNNLPGLPMVPLIVKILHHSVHIVLRNHAWFTSEHILTKLIF